MWAKITASIAFVFVIGTLIFEVLTIIDIRAFEYRYVLSLLGAEGLLVVAAIHLLPLGIGYWALVGLNVVRQPRVRLLPAAAVMLVPTVLLVWLLDWILLEKPLTARPDEDDISVSRREELRDVASNYAYDRGGINAYLERTQFSSTPDKRDLAVMIARVAINHPHSFQNASIGSTISKYSQQYDIHPTLLFAWAYLDSFYGEATSGPMPFFRSMTGETFRDFVQVHLPAWFVESPLRIHLIQSDWLEQVAGKEVGRKLRYALHKATYDVSVDPYDTNIFSDAFLVFQEYPTAFPELSEPTSKIDVAMQGSFQLLSANIQSNACHSPYAQPRRDNQFYDANRDHLITFARAVFYKLLFDFDFATRVQALVARYYDQLFEVRLGASAWRRVDAAQKAAMLAMLRDVYVPNIGKLSANLYLLPELNCTPFEFIVKEASRADLIHRSEIWRPRQREKLWAAATFKLRNLGEVWQVSTGKQFNIGEPVTETIPASEAVIARNVGRLK